ncbi:MAG: NADH-ubiquinone oxidoreductase-F iron-sulfur binding region domain-containing protein [Candidatus Dormibacteria bacterium]
MGRRVVKGFGLLGSTGGDVCAGYLEHARAFGPVPGVGADFIDVLDRSGLRGRGGGAFPTATKWAAVAAARARNPVVLANGAEGEPASAKDRLLMRTRPHLLIDGTLIAARTVGARDIVFYVGGAHSDALSAMTAAIAERPEPERSLMTLVAAPPGYVAGEETAAVHFINDGVALPLSTPPRPHQRGVNGRPTLVNNVETLAHVALIARFGDAWFRGGGTGDAPGTLLLTLGGAVQQPGVVEVPNGATVADAVRAAGGLHSDCDAVLVGGYFGTWHAGDDAWATRLDAASLRDAGHTLGCGVVYAKPAHVCGVESTSRVLAYLAGESAQQCGPCVFGLRAIADALARVAASRGGPHDLERLHRWAGVVRGRGACRHPDGASQFVRSALNVFAGDFDAHAHGQRCLAKPLAVAS